MNGDMPRKLPPFVTRERTRHGAVIIYFRRNKGPRIRLPDIAGPEFHAAYVACLAGEEPPRPIPVMAGTIEWLIGKYRETTSYRGLSAATRRQRDNIFKHVIEKSGKERFRDVTRKAVVAGRDARAATPAQARNFLDAMRGLFRWALEAELMPADPTVGVKNPPRRDGDGFRAWTEEDVASFERRWPIGTKERVWLDVLLYTGLRRGDAVRLGRQHVKDGAATLKTEKSGFTVEVTIPIIGILQRTLDAGPTSDLAFICGDRRTPLTKESFGNVFRGACNKAGLKGLSAHGLRKMGAARAADAGATVNQLEALFGWVGGAMASRYTKTADRRRLAKQAMDKIENAIARTGVTGSGKISKS